MPYIRLNIKKIKLELSGKKIKTHRWRSDLGMELGFERFSKGEFSVERFVCIRRNEKYREKVKAKSETTSQASLS